MKFLEKAKNFVPALWVAVLPFLTQLTMSGADVSFTADEISNIGSALTTWSSSVVGMLTSLLPWMILITIVWIVIGLITGFGKLRVSGWRKLRRIG